MVKQNYLKMLRSISTFVICALLVAIQIMSYVTSLYEKNMRVSKLSLGMKQRLALCQAFMEDPAVLLLDEPFNALDSKNMHILTDVIAKEKAGGKIIIVAAHNIPADLQGVFDETLQMENGEIVKTN